MKNAPVNAPSSHWLRTGRCRLIHGPWLGAGWANAATSARLDRATARSLPDRGSVGGMEVINLRSDTGTLPTAPMLQAIAEAPLGDDTYGEDPTVMRLQTMAAERMGKEAALLVPSGHMGNLVALMVHAGPGDAVLLDAESHVYWYETGSMASLAGVMPHPLPSTDGRLDPQGRRQRGAPRRRPLRPDAAAVPGEHPQPQRRAGHAARPAPAPVRGRPRRRAPRAPRRRADLQRRDRHGARRHRVSPTP